MSLPVWATPDAEGYSTYPEALCGQFLAKMLHVRDPNAYHLALCGVLAESEQEYLGLRPRRVKVCPTCRRKADVTR